MTGNDAGLIRELIEIFIAQVEELGTGMEDANARRDFEKLGKLAHKAKASIAIMGMGRLSKKLKEFEKRISKGIKADQYPVFISFFKEECHEAAEELRIYRDTIST
jgi:HPt (histidine-containing phosphotransfer) domain-containing protein